MASTDWLVILEIASRRVAATVAQRERGQGEQVKAHKVVHCDWLELSETGRRQAVAEALSAACDAVGIKAFSVCVAVSDAKLRGNFAVGYANLEQEMVLREEEVHLALSRAAHQAISNDRVVLHALPQRWEVRSSKGQRSVDQPLGEVASHLTCHVLLVTAEKAQQDAISELLESCGSFIRDADRAAGGFASWDVFIAEKIRYHLNYRLRRAAHQFIGAPQTALGAYRNPSIWWRSYYRKYCPRITY